MAAVVAHLGSVRRPLSAFESLLRAATPPRHHSSEDQERQDHGTCRASSEPAEASIALRVPERCPTSQSAGGRWLVGGESHAEQVEDTVGQPDVPKITATHTVIIAAVIRIIAISVPRSHRPKRR